MFIYYKFPILCRCSTGADPTALGSATKVGGGGGGGSGKKIHKKGGKILGRLHTPGDVYCTASRRSTMTSPKPLTDKP